MFWKFIKLFMAFWAYLSQNFAVYEVIPAWYDRRFVHHPPLNFLE